MHFVIQIASICLVVLGVVLAVLLTTKLAFRQYFSEKERFLKRLAGMAVTSSLPERDYSIH